MEWRYASGRTKFLFITMMLFNILETSFRTRLVTTCLVMFSLNVVGQDISADEHFKNARTAAFENDNYIEAIRLSKLALARNPGYTEIQVFLGRVYFWNKQEDSSLLVLKSAVEKEPAYEEATIALADVEYFGDRFSSALYYLEAGLKYHPNSPELKLRKAKSLAGLKRYTEAARLTDSLLKADPKNINARSLANMINDYSAVNKIGISYDRTGFDKQFADPWQLVSVDYTRQAAAGSLTGRINYARRHQSSGVQVELDAYPRISKTFYAYTNLGYSADMPVFPKFRAGFSLYANLPRSFEADAGFRYLNFDNDTWMYTLSLGKYYKNFWFNGRTYLTPANSRISQSYTLTGRYYLGGADDYISVFGGRGISPDDRILAVQLNNSYKLISSRIGAGYKFTVGKLNIFNFSATFENVEYLPKTTGNQLTLSAGYQRRF